MKISVSGLRWLAGQSVIYCLTHQSTMNQFYVVLPSDSSINYYPDNTVAHFKTKLAHPICIDGNYEVALTELIYPMSYHNFIAPDEVSLCYPPEGREIFDKRLSCFNLVNWRLQSGYFKDEEALVDYLNKDLMKSFSKLYNVAGLEPFFTFNGKKIRFKLKGSLDLVENGGNVYKADLNAREAGVSLGLINKLKLGKNEPFELSDYQSLIYVYSDIVGTSLVGDVQVPLLRVIATNGEWDETISEVCHNPYYVPVARRGFDTIEININTQLGAPMPFTGGKAVVVLHFRRHGAILSNTA